MVAPDAESVTDPVPQMLDDDAFIETAGNGFTVISCPVDAADWPPLLHKMFIR